jgi:LysM domain
LAALNHPTVQYTVVAGDTFQSIAEKYGHSGEWRALLEANTGLDLVDGQPRRGSELQVPWPVLTGQFSGNWTTSLPNVIETAYPDLKDHRDRYEQIARELHANGLFAEESLSAVMTSAGALQKRTTQLGDQFLAFITAPETP